ncbi:MAG: lytic transglycosylase domain-containing protein, partial [bacterium]
MNIESIQSRIYEIEARFQTISAVNFTGIGKADNNSISTVNSRESSKVKNDNNITAEQLTENDFSQLFMQYAEEYDLDPDLVKAVAKAESGFNAKAVSLAGAKGIMQLMPATAKELGVRNILDPAENIAGGTKYLKRMLERYNGDVKLALAAYNAGSGNVDKFGGIPPFAETKNYVNKVQKYYQQIKQ